MIIIHIGAGMGNQMFMYAAGLSLASKYRTELLLEDYSFDEEFNYISDINTVFSRPYCLNCFPNITERRASLRELFRIYPGKAVALSLRLSHWPLRHPPRHIFRRLMWAVMTRTSFVENKLDGRRRKDSIFSDVYFARVYAPKKSALYSPEFFDVLDNTYVKGFWESEKFFDDIADKVRVKFRFSPECFNPELTAKITSCNSAALHIRRGDKADHPHMIHNEYYIKSSIEKLASLTESPEFFVFSDEIDWCRENLPKIYDTKYHFIEGQTPPQDMALMTICRHVIISFSTFSWWGAWLNENPNKIVIAPGKNLWNHGDDFLLDDWIKIT